MYVATAKRLTHAGARTMADTAIAKAREYGVATQDLTAAQAAGEAKIRDLANKQINDFDAQLRLRRRVASTRLRR